MDGTTTSKASVGSPPWLPGSVSSGMILYIAQVAAIVPVRSGDLARPASRFQMATQVVQHSVGNLDSEWFYVHNSLYLPALIKSATRSPIIIVVALVLARIQSGMMEASAIHRPSSPWTRPY